MSSAINDVAPNEPFSAFPIRLVQTSSRVGIVVKLLFIGAAGIVLLTPFAMLAVIAATDPAGFLSIARKPMVAFQLSLALLISVAFVIMPLRQVIATYSRGCTIAITRSAVTVAKRGRSGWRDWQEPLENYSGIAHSIRTSLAGARHELVLVHPDPSKSVPLKLADRTAQSNIDALSRLTGLPEIHARAPGGPRGAHATIRVAHHARQQRYQTTVMQTA